MKMLLNLSSASEFTNSIVDINKKETFSLLEKKYLH